MQTEPFDFSSEQRAVARARLGAGPGTHGVLFLGRLSFHAKAHPLAMYQALERASRGLPGPAQGPGSGAHYRL